MKIIKYLIGAKVNIGTYEEPIFEDVLTPVEIHCTADNLEANLEIARAESYNGVEPEVTDDGQPDPEETPSQMDVIEAQVTYTAMMTDTLLEV